jgi:WD40 repeat protein
MQKFNCPHCDKMLQLRENMLGKTIRCPGCQKTFPAPASAPAPVAEEEIPEVLPADPPAVEEVLPASAAAPPRRPVLREEPDDMRSRAGRKPAAQRKGVGVGLVVGILATLLVLCGGGATAVYFVGKAIVNAGRQMSTAFGAGPQPIPPTMWMTSRPIEGYCTISMPGQPYTMERSEAASSHPGIRRLGISRTDYHRTFLIGYLNLSAAQLAELAPTSLTRLTQAEIATLQNQSATLVSQQAGTTAGYAIQDLVFDLPDSQPLIERIVLAPRSQGAMVYFLAAWGEGLTLNHADVTRFFQSLQIDADTGPNPNPNPPPNTNPKPGTKPPSTPQPDRLTLQGDRLRIHPTGTRLVCYSPDGQTLAALGEDGVLTLTNVADLTVRAKVPNLPGMPRDLFFARRSSRLAVVTDETVRVYSSFGKQLASLPFKHAVAAAFSPSGVKLCVAVAEPAGAGKVHFWDSAKQGEEGPPLDLPEGATDLAWSADGTRLAIALGAEVRLFDTAARKERWKINAHTRPITGLAFHPDRLSLVTAGSDGTIKRWRSADGKIISVFEGQSHPAGRPVFSRDGTRLATYGGPEDLSVLVWDTASSNPLGRMVVAPAEVSSLSFHPNGQMLAIATRGHPVRLWNTGVLQDFLATAGPYGKPTRPEEATRFSFPGQHSMARFSPDGKTLAVSRDGELVLLHTDSWKRRAHKTLASAGLVFAFSSNGRLVSAGHSTGASPAASDSRDAPPRRRRGSGGPGMGGAAVLPETVRVYLRSADSASLLGEFPAGAGYVRSLAVSADGNLVAVSFATVPRPRFFGQPPPANASGLIRVWDISGEPKLLPALEKLPYPVAAVAISADGKTLHAAAGRTVRRWQLPACTELPELKGPTADLAALAVAADGHVYAAGADMMIHSWDADGRYGLPWEGHTDMVGNLALTADGQRLASVARDGTCRLWNTASGEKLLVTKAERGFDTAPPLLALSPDGALLALDAPNYEVAVLKTKLLQGQQAPAAAGVVKKPVSEPATVAAFAETRGGNRFLVNAAFSSSQTLLTADNVGGAQLWKWPAGTLRDTCHHPSSAVYHARSRDGKVLALASGNSVYLREPDTGKLRATVTPEDVNKHPNGQLVHMALSPDGDLLAMALSLGNDSEVITWDVKQNRQRSVAHVRFLSCLAFSPDGKTLAVGVFSPASVVLFDTSDLKEGKRIAEHQRGIKALAFSPDGKKLATSTDDGLVMMWSLADGKKLWSKGWSQANAWKQSIGFSPDGKWLVAAPLSKQHGLVLIDAADGSLRADVTRYPMPNSIPDFSPDGKLLAVVLRVPSQAVVYDVEKLVAKKP